jgi:hypothetical protein
MLAAEAASLCEILLGQADISPLLNLGSSTRSFREVEKPHVERDLFAPLRRAGVSVLHSDAKAAEGVDLAGDVLDPEVKRSLKARNFRCVLLANLLEHVPDRDAVAQAAEDIVGPNGLILATVPLSYPYHADPIDNHYRPSPAALAGLFGRSRLLLAEEVVGPTFREELKERRSAPAAALARTFLWFLLSPVRPRSFASRAHRWLWYSRPYRISVVLLRVC